jgi:MFS family permease
MSRRDDENEKQRSYTAAVITLCLCSLANALVITSVFPYSGYMVLSLLPETTPETVGSSAGILAASFMAGRFLTAYRWGQVADSMGRVFVLQCSLTLSVVFSIIFGTSSNYTIALFWRLCLGMSNAITSTSKTLASEIGHGDDNKEKQAMGLVIGMRSWGFLIGPAIGGLLADPVKQYPNHYSEDSWLANVFRCFPYLLPNLAVATVCLIAAITVPLSISETLDHKERSNSQKNGPCHTMPTNERKPLMTADPSNDTEFNEISIWSCKRTRLNMIFNWIFSFAVTVIDDGFPLFCISTVGGLGYDETSIGQVLSLAGLIFAVGQYATYTVMVHRLGLYPSITVGCALGLVPASLIPLAVWLNRTGQPEWVIMLYLSVVLGICKIMVCACFSSLAIATNQSVTKRQRAKMNGLLLLGSSITKGLGPIFVGYLVSLSFSGNVLLVAPEYGSIVIFGAVGGMGLLVTLVAVRLERLQQVCHELTDTVI